jgi:ankyrin repeat protein
MVKQALLRGADPNARDANGQVALFVALRRESLQAAEALLEHPAWTSTPPTPTAKRR